MASLSFPPHLCLRLMRLCFDNFINDVTPHPRSVVKTPTMAPRDKDARLWFYSRDLLSVASLPTSSKGADGTGGPRALKHWAVLLEYMSTKKPGKVNNGILYEANNEQGLLVAREVPHGNDEEEEWEQSSGFVKRDHGMVRIHEARAKSYCRGFNEQRIRYVATRDNCQRFVSEFIANLLPDSAIPLPRMTAEEAKSWCSSASSTAINFLANLGSAALVREFLIKTAVGSGTSLKDVITMFNLSIGKQSLLKQWMAKEGAQIMRPVIGRSAENMVNVCRGAFTWWNLLQVPVEMFVGKLLRCAGCSDLQAYGGKKAASVLTAAGVGLVVAGPFGCLGSVCFWIVAEVIATLVKLLLGEILGEGFTAVFGESDTVNLIKSIYRYFEMKMISGLDAGLEWLLECKEESAHNRFP